MSIEILEREILPAFNAAAATWDADCFAELYAEDACFFGLLTYHSVGVTAVREYFAHYAEILNGAVLALDEQEIRVLGPDAFIAQGLGHFTYNMADGTTSRNTLRTTLGLQRQDGAWKIVIHHFSPIPPTPSYGH